LGLLALPGVDTAGQLLVTAADNLDWLRSEAAPLHPAVSEDQPQPRAEDRSIHIVGSRLSCAG
jgi:hypothetical protein